MTEKYYAVVTYGDPSDQHVHVEGTVTSRESAIRLAKNWADDHLHIDAEYTINYLGKDPNRP